MVAVLAKPVIGALLAPIVNAVVAEPAKFTVVAVVFNKSKLVLAVVILVAMTGVVNVLDAGIAKVVPEEVIVADPNLIELPLRYKSLNL